jgi:hypothetical protein
MYAPGRNPINRPLMSWAEALEQPGAAQMRHGRKLMESRPFLTRIPDDSLIVPSSVLSAMPGAGRYRFVATRDANGSYAMVYAPVGRPFLVDVAKLSGNTLAGWWFNPRTGQTTRAGEYERKGQLRFVPPDSGEMLDWVLVLDDKAKNYPPPGQ